MLSNLEQTQPSNNIRFVIKPRANASIQQHPTASTRTIFDRTQPTTTGPTHLQHTTSVAPKQSFLRSNRSSQQSVTNTMSSLSSSEDILLITDAITKVDGSPTCTTLRQSRIEIAKFANGITCDLEQAAGHGHSFLCYTDAQWLAKIRVTTLVPMRTHPGPLVGTTHADRYAHETCYRQFAL